MNDESLAQLRAVCLAFPEAVEAGGVGVPSFTVRDKIFAMQHPANGRPSLRCKAEAGFQPALVASDPSAVTAGSGCGSTSTRTWVSLPTSSKRATA